MIYTNIYHEKYIKPEFQGNKDKDEQSEHCPVH